MAIRVREFELVNYDYSSVCVTNLVNMARSWAMIVY